MAALQLREDTATGRLILQPGLGARLGNLLFGFIWLVGAGVFLLPALSGGRVDWLGVLAFLLFAVIPVGAPFLNAAFPRTVTIDRGTRTLSSVRSFFFLPIMTTTWNFNDLAKIQVQYVSRSSAVNVWLVNAVNRENKRLVLNWNGSKAEITNLAEKVSALTGAPVVQMEYTLPSALQDVLKKVAPTESEQTPPPAREPAPSPSAPTPTVMEQLLRDIVEQAKAKEAEQPVSPAPTSPPNELSPAPETEIASALAPKIEDAKPVWNLPTGQLEQRVASDSLDSDARYALARRYHSRGDLDRAIDLYRQVVRIDATNPGAQNDLGVVLQARGKRAEAEAAYRRAAALDPFSTTAHLNLALLLRDAKRATEASQEFFLARQNARGVAERNAAEAASSGAKMDPQLSKL